MTRRLRRESPQSQRAERTPSRKAFQSTWAPEVGAERGESGVALAKELKVALPTMYNTLKRAGWKARRS